MEISCCWIYAISKYGYPPRMADTYKVIKEMAGMGPFTSSPSVCGVLIATFLGPKTRTSISAFGTPERRNENPHLKRGCHR